MIRRLIALGRIPVVRDLFDVGASRNAAKTQWADTLWAVVPPAVASAIGFSETLQKIATKSPQWEILTSVLPLLLVTALALVAVTAKRSYSDQSVLTIRATAEPRLVYRYPQPVRILSKLTVLPLCLLIWHRIDGDLPNWLLRNETLGGVLCNAEGAPVALGGVDILDKFGRPVNTRRAPLDSLGFFYVHLRPWSLRPTFLLVRSRRCQDRINIGSGVGMAAPGCSVDAGGHPPPGDWHTWTTKCE